MNWGDQRVLDVFWDLVHPEPNSGCWLWTGLLHVAGYGRYRKSSADLLVHRVMYEAVNGPHADGLEIDHLCRTRSCCNPQHLEAVTHAENVRRGTAWTWRLARTHGSCGHPLDLIYNGYRRCSICNTASKRKYKEKMKKLRSK